MKKRLISCLFVLFVFSVLAEAPANLQRNLLHNADFSEMTKGWLIEETHHPEKIFVVEESITGSRDSLMTDGSFDEGEPLFIMLTQDITLRIKPSTKYLLKADIRRTSRGRIEVCVLERENATANWKEHSCGSVPGEKLNRWEHFEHSFVTSGTVESSVVVIYNLLSGGIACFDNLELTEAEKE